MTDNHPLSFTPFSLTFVPHHPVSLPPSPHRFFTLVSVGLISWWDLCTSNLLVLLSLLTLQQLTKLHQLAMQQTPFTPLGQTTPAFPGTYPQGPWETFPSCPYLFWHSMTWPLWFLSFFDFFLVYIFLLALSDIMPMVCKKNNLKKQWDSLSNNALRNALSLGDTLLGCLTFH